MTTTLEPQPLAALFPELPFEELAQLARHIKKQGQLQPIILHKGLFLDRSQSRQGVQDSRRKSSD